MKPLTGSALAAADEENKVAHSSWIQERTRGMQVFSDDELVVVDSGIASDTFNVVCRARLGDAVRSERIQAVVRHFRSVGRPFTWWVGPADRPSGLGEALLEQGFVATGTEPGMAADLERLPKAELAPHGLRIERAKSPEQVQEYAGVLASLADPPDVNVLRFYERGAPAVLAADSPLRFYVGYLREEPVASAELTTAGGIVGLYNIATRSRHRRKGIGTAMTLGPLLDAREAGYATAVLEASPDGFPIYRRLGFEVTGSFTEYHVPEGGSPALPA